MTKKDFCYWLKGYLEAGQTVDAEPIKQKLEQALASSDFTPTQTVYIDRHYPYYPYVTWHNYNAGGGGVLTTSSTEFKLPTEGGGGGGSAQL